MKRLLVSAALLLSSTASALTTAQREQHFKEVFAAAGIPQIPCPASATVAVRMCGQVPFSGSLVRDSWDVYAADRASVTVQAIHDSPWALSADGSVYSARFATLDDDTYAVAMPANTSGTFVVATWAGGKPATGAVAAAPAKAPAAPPGKAPMDLSRPKAECDPGAIHVNNIGGRGWVSATWYQDAVFPTPAQEFTRGQEDKFYNQTCPNFQVTFDPGKGEYVFRGKSFEDVLNYGGLGLYPNSSSISLIDESSFLQIANIGVTYDRSAGTFRTVGQNTSDFGLTAMGYRVDGGALQPLFFQGKIYDMVVPVGAKMLEVYAQPGQYTGWQYVKVDIAASTLTAERTYPFPEK